MDVLLDCEASTYDSPNGTVYSFRGRVTNLPEVKRVDPWLHRFIRSDQRLTDNGIRWTIQGNDFAEWMVK
jgi:hypothetical protein